MELIKKDLDSELGELLPKKKIDKENEGYFDVEKKHIVIGEQLPKMYHLIYSVNKKTSQTYRKSLNAKTTMDYKVINPKTINLFKNQISVKFCVVLRKCA